MMKTDDDILLSVIVPTFGRDAVLVDSVRHLLARANPANEVLVIDQTPTHDADVEATLSRWEREGHIRWIRHQPPGVVGAMNRGLREAVGAVVLFLDDDIIPSADLIAAHARAHAAHPEAWAVVGRVLQPEDAEEPAAAWRIDSEEPGTDVRARSGNGQGRTSVVRRRVSPLRRDLDVRFNMTAPAWVENVIACNLSVKRDRALALGGFDANFIPPVSYRFETEFARRIIAAGGKIWFEPSALIHHLRAERGGTRIGGSHLTSASPAHGVGDYYYAMKHGRGWDRIRYIARRPFREVCTRFHLRYPWWIPVKFIGEVRALVRALALHRQKARVTVPERSP